MATKKHSPAQTTQSDLSPDALTPATPATPAQSAAPNTENAKLIRKLSSKNIIGKIDVGTLGDEPKKMFRIAGVVSGYESGESATGPWECLTGDFAATNFLTGEVFAGNKAFIPGGSGDGIVAAAAHALRENAKSKIRFAVDVYVKKVMRGNEIGYAYETRPLIQINVKNEALDMLASLGD